MADSEDHREKNILLAKNLNEVKMDLRAKKKDLITLQSQLRVEKQRNSRLATEQVSILDQIDCLKKQLEETFVKSTFGYMHLSKQLDQMHDLSIQTACETSVLRSPNAGNSTIKSSESSLMAKLKTFTESMASNKSDASTVDFEASFNHSINQSEPTAKRHSLSFNSFKMGLNSTFVKDAEIESESALNRTFFSNDSEIAVHDENKENNAVQAAENQSYVTVRKSKKKARPDQSQMKSRINDNQSPTQHENQLTATDLLNTPNVALRRGCRSVKRIDYNERSFRRHK